MKRRFDVPELENLLYLYSRSILKDKYGDKIKNFIDHSILKAQLEVLDMINCVRSPDIDEWEKGYNFAIEAVEGRIAAIKKEWEGK